MGGELMINFLPGQHDIYLGPPPWEFDRALSLNAWIYQLTLISGRALEPQEVLT